LKAADHALMPHGGWPKKRRAWVNFAVPITILFFIPFSLSFQFTPLGTVNSRVRKIPRIPLPVTILIPVFNREKYLRRALSSAVNQSLRDIEILIVDDGSTDNSSFIAEEFQRADDRIRILRHSANSGTHVARITGVENAHGAYILSLDPDDIMLPHLAEDTVQIALLHNADMVEFQSLEVVEGTAKLFSFLNPPTIELAGSELLELFRNHGLNWNLWKRLIRRSVYLRAVTAFPRAVKIKRVIYAEDKLQFGTMLLFTKRYYFFKGLGYIYYRDNPDNSESGVQQTKKEALKQLRYVERGLRFMYKTIGNLTYKRWTAVPDAFGKQAKKALEALDGGSD
jgi:glycosyltransferase involved in cell wall biosynthesis